MMLKKLKIKFYLISLLSILFVLATTITVINIANYSYIEKSATTTLNEVIDHGLEEKGHGGDVPPENVDESEFAPGDRPGDKRGFIKNSFFISVYDKDGNLTDYNYDHVFGTNEEACKNLSLQALNGELKGKKYGDYRFKVAQKDDGLTYVAFVDLKIDLENANHFLLVSSLISVGAYIVLAALIFVISKIALRPSEEAYKKQKKFITNASHELKTPLTVISADLDLVELDHGKSEWTESIRSQVNRLTTMTKQLVDLSRLEEDDSSNYPFEDFSVNEVCDKVIKDFEPLFKKEGIKFSQHITGNLTIYGNKYLIEDMLHIFFENSLKYTGGDKKASYFVVSEGSKRGVEFKFSNTLDKDDETDTKQIMERFYRSPSVKKEGSGIGLSIAQEIINLHKGKIKIDKNNSAISFSITFD